MPRPKKENQTTIKLKSVDTTIIERKDCLQVNLCFTDVDVFTKEEWGIIGSRFGCKAVDDNTITLKTQNSWKGLVMFFLALANMMYKEKLEQALGMMARPKRSTQLTITNVSRDYWVLVKDSIGRWETKSDPRIEKIPAPPDYPPCYVVGRYEPADVKLSLDNFCLIYGIDMEQSTVETAFVSNTQPRYKTHSVENPYKRPETVRISTVEALMKHIRDKNRDPLGMVDLTGKGEDRSGSSKESS